MKLNKYCVLVLIVIVLVVGLWVIIPAFIIGVIASLFMSGFMAGLYLIDNIGNINEERVMESKDINDAIRNLKDACSDVRDVLDDLIKMKMADMTRQLNELAKIGMVIGSRWEMLDDEKEVAGVLTVTGYLLDGEAGVKFANEADNKMNIGWHHSMTSLVKDGKMRRI